MFVKVDSGMHVVVLLYVDDMIISGDKVVEITCLHDELLIRFEMKRLLGGGAFSPTIFRYLCSL